VPAGALALDAEQQTHWWDGLATAMIVLESIGGTIEKCCVSKESRSRFQSI